MNADKTFSSWESAVAWLRLQPDQAQLVSDCYYDDPLIGAADRYWQSEEWQAVRTVLTDRSGLALDVIFHLAGGSSVGAAIANPHEDFTRTVVSTAELLDWLRQYSPSTRLVAVSSAAVYGSAHSGPIPEDARLSPFSPYGTHKMMMEDICRSYAANFGLQVMLPRLFSVYGIQLKKQLLWDLCSKLAAGGMVELGGTGNELRDWTDIRDVVRALDQVVSLASNQAPVLNLATGHATSVREIAAAVVRNWHDTDATQLQFSGLSRAGDPFSLVANIDRMHAHGIACTIPVNRGIAEYVDWFRAEARVSA